jgi:uncharacterized CHY-type Zn-finger protein
MDSNKHVKCSHCKKEVKEYELSNHGMCEWCEEWFLGRGDQED